MTCLFVRLFVCLLIPLFVFLFVHLSHCVESGRDSAQDDSEQENWVQRFENYDRGIVEMMSRFVFVLIVSIISTA